jgi:sterol desaturase/sphingolipid hydroxylase (fatty acid hydroxylase superfamily)
MTTVGVLSVERIRELAGMVLTSLENQLGGTFLRPGSSFSIAALAVSLLIFVLVAIPAGRKVRFQVIIRILFPRRLLATASGRADIGFYIFSILFAGLLVGWAMFSAEQVRAWVQVWLGAPPDPRLPRWAAAPIATVVLFLAFEFAYWVDHWLMHRVPFLWHLHKVHHRAESLSLLTRTRVHPLETIGFYNLVALTVGLAGAILDQLLGRIDPYTIGGTNLLIMLFAITITQLQHSHLWVGFGPFWGRLLLGPAHHQIHHSANTNHFNRNFGSCLALFDRLFGTFHMPSARREPLRFGVDDAEAHPHSMRASLLTPILSMATELVRLAAPARSRRADSRIAVETQS